MGTAGIFYALVIDEVAECIDDLLLSEAGRHQGRPYKAEVDRIAWRAVRGDQFGQDGLLASRIA